MQNFLEYPCPNCGATLQFDPTAQNLKCNHCNSVIPIEKKVEVIKEEDIAIFLASLNPIQKEIQTISYACTRCGKENEIQQDTPSFECSNCDNKVINTFAFENQAINPNSLVPFNIAKNKIQTIFQNWINSGFWTSSDFKKISILDQLRGCYIPFWTFDAQTETIWNGEAGEYYYKTVSYKNSEGNMEEKIETHTKWHYKSGHLSKFFNDILICGSDEITHVAISKIFPFNLNELVPFDYKYLTGWGSDTYSYDIKNCYELSKNIIADAIYKECGNLCKIDTYRDLSIATTYSKETYKHILLPVWIGTYIYKNKKYDFLINGQSGKIEGSKPISTTKVGLVIILVIVFLIIASLLL